MADFDPFPIQIKPRLPIEVCERIIEAAWDARYSLVAAALATLSSCALVCRDWRPRAQRVLFEYVTLRDKDGLYRFAELLNASPELAGYVDALALRGYLHVPSSPVVQLPTVLRGIRRLTNLRSLYLLAATDDEKAAKPLPEGKKELPSLPIHRYFPSLLSSIAHIRRLNLVNIMFSSLGDFARILNALSSLEELACRQVSWAALGQEPPCMTKNRLEGSRNAFLPRLRVLQCYHMDELSRQRLISALGPSLQELWLNVPNQPPSVPSVRQEQGDETPDVSLALNGRLFPHLQCLIIELRSLAHTAYNEALESIQNILGSWTASVDNGLEDSRSQYLRLFLRPRNRFASNREDFVQLLRTIRHAVEAVLCSLKTPGDADDKAEVETDDKAEPCHATVVVWDLGDRIEWGDWWKRQVEECFPTLSNRHHLDVRPAHCFDTSDRWKDYNTSPSMQIDTPDSKSTTKFKHYHGKGISTTQPSSDE